MDTITQQNTDTSFRGLFSRISTDADELISRTVLRATGQHFQDYVEAGNVPPIGLMLKAYWACASHHGKEALSSAFRGEKSNPNKAESLDADDKVVCTIDVTPV